MVQQVESCKQFIYVCLLGGGGGNKALLQSSR